MRPSKAKEQKLTAAKLKSLLHYDPATGDFTWLVSSGTSKVGKKAGTQHPKGYWQIGIEKTYHQAHRLAWLYMTGAWPSDVLDHRNLNKKDNRWENLRLAGYNGNNRNKPLSVNNTSGYKGVFWERGMKKWRVRIRIDGGRIHIGYWDDPREAYAAYCAAVAKHHGDFARVE